MSYYIGRLQVFWEEYESFSDCCIAATNEEQARERLHARATMFVDAPSPSRKPTEPCASNATKPSP